MNAWIHSRSAIVNVASIALTSLALVACNSAPKARIDKDANTNVAHYKTFAWYVPQKEPPKSETPADDKEKSKSPSAPVAKVNTLVEGRVHGSLAAALQAKGYTLDETNPDFRVHYVLNVGERPKESGMRIGLGAGGGSGNVGGGVGLSLPIGKRTENFGALTVDIIDAKRNAQVWTGSYDNKIASPDIGDADVNKLVGIILEKFPAHTMP